MSRKLFVGNIPFETGEDELQALFSQAGNVETVTVMRDRATGRARTASQFTFAPYQVDCVSATAALLEEHALSMCPRSLRNAT